MKLIKHKNPSGHLFKYNIPLENDPDIEEMTHGCITDACSIPDGLLECFPGLLVLRPDVEAMADCIMEVNEVGARTCSTEGILSRRFEAMKRFGEVLLDLETYCCGYFSLNEDGTANIDVGIGCLDLGDQYLSLIGIPFTTTPPYNGDIIKLSSSSVKMLVAFQVERLLKLGINFLSHKGDPQAICEDDLEEYQKVGLYYIKLAVNYDDGHVK